MRARLCGALLLSAVVTGPAQAHHGALRPRRDTAAAGDRPSTAAVAASATAFDIDDEEGRFYTVAAELQLRLGDRWALGLRAPMHHVVETGTDPVSGIGDLVVGGRMRAAMAGWIGWGGVDLLLPTGDPERGLGHGDATVAVSAQATRGFGENWRAGGLVAGLADVTSREAMTTAVVEHRADAELRVAAVGSWTNRRLRAGGELRLTVPLAPGSARGHAYPTAAPSLAVNAGKGAWVELSAEVPLAPSRQLDWQAGLALVWEWGAR
jgi:hypothetical protein